MRAVRASSGLSQLVSSEMCQNPEDRAALSVADELIRTGLGKSLYKALLKRLGATYADPSAVIGKLLAMLESSMEEQSGVSAYLMARLHARAHGRREHAVCHTIELWMSGLATEEAAAALELLAGEVGRPAFKRRCGQWADGIRRRASLCKARSPALGPPHQEARRRRA